METTFKAPGGQFKFTVDALLKVENGNLYCNRVNNAIFLDKTAISLFEKDGLIIKKVWIDDFNVSLTQIKNITIPGYSKSIAALIVGLVSCIGLTAFSFFTDSLYWWNGLFYLLIFFYFIFLFFKGKTSIKLSVSPIGNDKTYDFTIIAMGNAPNLTEFANELRNKI
jgi:hypothetical protein